MKKLILSVFALAAVVLSANAAGNTAVETSYGKAELVQTIAIAKATDAPNSATGDLEFGKIAITFGETGYVIITPAANGAIGTPTTGGTATLVSGGAARSAAAFSVSGQTGRVYSIEIPSSVDISNGDNKLTIDSWNCSKLASGTIDALAANNIFYVGGRVNIDAADPVGSYSGTFNVTVTYN